MRPVFGPPLGWRTLILAALALGVGGCREEAGGKTAGVGGGDEGGTCAIVARATTLGEEVHESSGAAWSGTPGVFWTHNDSGNEPVLFGVDTEGLLAARVRLPGARMKDWEDVAVGPCEEGRCVYAADTGDNGRGKNDPVALWVFPEPALDAATAAPLRRFLARFPGGNRDAEALFVLPDGRIYLISKGKNAAVDLFQWPTPLVEDSTAELVQVRRLGAKPDQPGDLVTAASASPNGEWVAVRTYALLAIYRTADLLGGGEPVARMELAPLGEAQGEAVALRDDGTVVLTSEGQARSMPGSVSVLACSLPQS